MKRQARHRVGLRGPDEDNKIANQWEGTNDYKAER